MSNIRLRYIRGWVDKKTGKPYWRFRRRGYKEVTLTLTFLFTVFLLHHCDL